MGGAWARTAGGTGGRKRSWTMDGATQRQETIATDKKVQWGIRREVKDQKIDADGILSSLADGSRGESCKNDIL